MTQILPRFYRAQQAASDSANITGILAESTPAATTTVTRATLPGDTRRLRGIPCIARGVTGTSPGTDPAQYETSPLRHHR